MSWTDIIFGKTDQSYRQEFLKDDKNLLRIVILVIVVWELSFIYTDYLLLNTSSSFFLILNGRMLFGVISISSIIFLNKNNDKNRQEIVTLLWNFALVMISFFASYLQPTLYNVKLSSHYILILGLYLIIPNRIIFKTIPALTITMLDILLFFQQISQNRIQHLSFESFIDLGTLLILNTIGIIVSARLERQRICQHLVQKTLSSGRNQLITLAITDSLTGILNRRGFVELVLIEMDRFQRYKTGFSFAIIDIDQLKCINDRYGHPTGDQAIQELIECIEKMRCSTDFLGRLAGDEFGLCMPGAGKKDVQNLMMRIKESLNKKYISLDCGAPLRVCFSAGITEIVHTDTDFDDLYRRADKALYQAKQKGRNRVEIV